MLSELQNLAERAEQLRKQFIEDAKAALTPALQQVFTDHPEIKAYGWAQYTPYFNDGEPCEFSVNDIYVSTSDEREDSFYGDGWTDGYGDAQGVSPEGLAKLGALQKTFGSMEEVLKDAFGDHVRVIVTRDGVDVDEYDHD